ncbi:PAS domain S-box protein [Pedobacter sp. B4-66]|uniref:PAS domain-containing protein n=1 Tax=Pedobacter sp. B4-66 TaxID=2817280 RepID=UPI0024E214F8|nr:PAS domain S-box protein [Pedobacter sp. B4-66]
MHCNSTISNRNAHDIFFEQCPLPMWIFDSENFQFLEVNPAAVTQYGYSVEEFLSMTILNIRPVEDICSIIDVVNESRRTRKSYRYNHRHIKKNGEVIQVTIASTYIEFKGKAARSVLILDITSVLKAKERLALSDRRFKSLIQDSTALIATLKNDFNFTFVSTKERLALSDRRFKSLIQDSTELIATLNSDFNFTFVSPSSLAVLGIFPDSLIGEKALDFIHYDDKRRIVAEINETQPIKSIHLSPFRFKTIHGEWRWLEVKLKNLIQDEAVKSFVCNATDVTSKMQEVHKRMQEEKWSKILESVVINTLDGIMVLDADQNNGTPIVYVNQAMLNISGYTRDELIGKDSAIFHGQNIEQQGLETFEEALKGKTTCSVELVNYTKLGVEYHISITISPILSDEGVVTHWISIQRDITKFKYEIQQLKNEIQQLKIKNSGIT